MLSVRLACHCLLSSLILIQVGHLAAAQPATALPWNVEALHQPPGYEWLDQSDSVHSLFYDGLPYHNKPTRVFAYYASPGTIARNKSLDKNLPAIVLVHGGGGTAFREWANLWASRGYAAIAMDLAGHRPIEGQNAHESRNRTQLADGGPGQADEEKFGSVDEPASEQWPYHAVADVILAHSLIRSFPGVDADRTAITGISWGGYLTCIVAGVDHRFQAAVPVYGCGYLHENSAWLNRFAAMSQTQRTRWIELWDPSRYLPDVSMPILFINGTNDFAYPLDSYMRSFDAVPGNKQLCITVNMPHGHPQGWAPQEISLFVDQHLKNGKALPIVDQTEFQDNELLISVSSSTPLAKAELHYTTQTTAINKREWLTCDAEIVDNQISVAAPPADSTAWFITVEDERGATISSRIHFESDSP